MKLLFIGKKNDAGSQKAAEFIRLNFPESSLEFGLRGDALSDTIANWKGDLLISYLSPWIISTELLARANFASINFHTGPTEYPGIGCTNFALYNNEKEYGVTCHHMLPQVDTGKIIAVRKFAIAENDSVYSLTQRCYEQMYLLFLEVLNEILKTGKLPLSNAQWKRKAYTRVELNELCKISLDMSEAEVKRRIRATTYPNMPGAYLELFGNRFIFESK